MNRFRFYHYRDHRDGDVLIAYTGNKPWYCGTCGDRNEDREFCGTCSTQRGKWQCGCGHLNPKHADDCESCGNTKPDDVE